MNWRVNQAYQVFAFASSEGSAFALLRLMQPFIYLKTMHGGGVIVKKMSSSKERVSDDQRWQSSIYKEDTVHKMLS